jgi:predicted secreted protein
VDLDAPNAAGTYTGNWRFAHADGTPFGSVLPVSIKVEKNPDPTRTPTNAVPTPTSTLNGTQTAVQQTLEAVAATQTAICQMATAAGTPPPC